MNYYNSPYNQQTTANGILWVQGEAQARGWLMAPNSTVLLMDSEAEKFYIKTTDGAGMPSLRVFDYTEVTPQSSHKGGNDIDPIKYATIESLDEMRANMDELRATIEELKTKIPKTTKKVAVENE